MTTVQRETTPKLDWPRPEVQAEWALLSRCLEDPGYLSTETPDEQVKALETAVAHGVEPLLYYRLNLSGALNGIPNHVAGRFHRTYLLTARANLILSSQLSSLIQGFQKAEVPVICVKGIVLAETVYKNLALRPAGDIDLVIHPEHVHRAREVLKRLRYELVGRETFGDSDREIAPVDTYKRPNNLGLTLELHYSLLRDASNALPVSSTWFWEHTISASINGSSVDTLNTEANLLYLCAHLASHHGWDPHFIWLYDIKALLEESNRFDWGLFQKLAETLQCESYAYHVLSAVRAFLHVSVPETVLGQLVRADRKSPILEWQTKLPSTRAIRTLADWSRLSGFGTRLRFVLHTVFPTRIYMIDRYRPPDRRLWPLLYPYRWSIMFRDVIQTIKMLLQQRKT
jgi:hypothetical protein